MQKAVVVVRILKMFWTVWNETSIANGFLKLTQSDYWCTLMIFDCCTSSCPKIQSLPFCLLWPVD